MVSIRASLAVTLLCLCSFAVLSECSRSVRYDGTQILRVDQYEQLSAAQKFAFRALLKNKQFKVKEWATNDIQVSKSDLESVQDYLKENHIPFSVMIADLQSEIDREDSFRHQHRAQHGNNVLKYNSPNDFFADYHSNDDINTFCANLAQQYPQLVTGPMVIGTSYGGLPIHAYKVTSQKNPGPKPAIYLESGIHAREWIAHATGTYMFNAMVTGYGNDTHITSLLDQLEFHFVPVVNVDGYVYTWTTDRMWRKTIKPNPGSSCIGTDPNRNWNNHWCEDGASTDPCDDSFCGSGPFSEASVKAVADYVASNNNIQVGVDFHSYSQLWMSPYGYTQSLPANNAAQTAMADAAVAALTAVYGTQYTEGPIYTTVYPASGSSADYFYDNTTHVKFSYGVELRDTGTYGFVLPPAQIIPSGVETLAGVLAMGDYLLKNPLPLESDVLAFDQAEPIQHVKPHHGKHHDNHMPHFGNVKPISRRPQN